MPLESIGDIEIFYERRGTGPLLLAISGTGADLRHSPTLLDSPLSKFFEVLSYDQRGLGRSSKPNRPYAMADYADDAASLMQAVGWVYFGGMVAQELAVRHPGRVSRLVLCCTASGGAGGASYPLHHLRSLSVAERSHSMIAISDVRHDENWQHANPNIYIRLREAFASDPFAEEAGRAVGAWRQLEARARHDTWDRLDRICCPTLVCGGRYDGQVRPQTVKNMADRIPCAHLKFYEGGHNFLAEDTNAWTDIAMFLGNNVC
jgi:3-oxoadipate enol-lactonase